MNEKLLFQAFDLQKFSPNARLQAVIDATHARTEGRELSDDELDMVAAAGTIDAEAEKRRKENQ